MSKKILISDTSKQFKFFKALVQDKKIRAAENKALIFGKKMCEEASLIEAYLTTKENENDPFFDNKLCYVLSSKGFKELSELVNPEPYGALVSLPNFSFDKIKKGIFILDRLQDPGNVGTLFRTSQGFGLDGLLLLEGTCDPYSSKVIRSSKGSVFKVPHAFIETEALEKWCKDHQLNLFIAELEGKALNLVEPKLPFALLLGNEAQGVNPRLKSIGECIHIPQSNLESLNVAIAGAIIAYTFTC